VRIPTPARRALSCAWALPFVMSSVASTASGQFNASLTRIEVNQAMQTVPNSTPLVAERSTFVRAQIRLTNPPMLPVPLDGLMRVYVDGVEAPESPIYSTNGPFPAPLISTLSTEDGTLNFVWQPPASNDVVIEVTVNTPGANFFPEPDLSDNTLTTPPLTFTAQKRTELAYAPVDYRPNGGPTPNVPDAALIEPGSGDNFLQAIYATHDWFYHRIDAPSKLWTSSLSGSGTALLNDLNVDIAMMSPVPDFLYAWIPGGLPYNGVAFLNQPVSLGNTQTFKFQRTFAHEVGHNVGLSHNSFQIGIPGVDVEHHLAITEAQPMILPSNRNDIMVPGLNTDQAWVREQTYSYFFNHPTFDSGSPAPEAPKQPSILITGTWNEATGEVEVDNVLNLPEGRPMDPEPLASSDFVVRSFANGAQVHELPIVAGGGVEDCEDAHVDEETGAVTAHEHADSATQGPRLVGFLAIVPQGTTPVDRISIDPVDGLEAASVELVRSPNAPEIAFTAPADTTIVDGQLTVAWQGSDADGDELSYYLRYSPDGNRMVPLATNVTSTSFTADLTQMPAFQNGQGFFELFASDGMNTTSARTPVLWGSDNVWPLGGNPPWVEVMTPDDGASYLKGATVILHSSGWDLEDRGLTGTSISWASDVDGPLGTGRLNSVATLSVGTHVITVTATDSSGMMETDSATITIVDRELPITGDATPYCTAKLSSAGCLPQISGVGQASATSGAFDVNASGVNNGKNGLMFYGYAADALPFQGGTLCVQSPLRRTTVQNSGGTPPPAVDCSGSFSFDFGATIQSGVDPLLTAGSNAYAQYWFRDQNDAFASGFSNALDISILP